MCSSNGHKYFLIFIEDYSLFTWLFPLKVKSDVLSIFHQFQSYVERQFNTTIKAFNSNWGIDNHSLHTYFK